MRFWEKYPQKSFLPYFSDFYDTMEPLNEYDDFIEYSDEPENTTKDVPEGKEELPEACTFYESIIEQHVLNIPLLIKKALVAAKYKLGKEVRRKHSHGYVLALSVLLDMR